MNVLFITRKYPPAVGGMETFSAGFVRAFAGDITLLALRTKSQSHLVWWLPWVCLKAAWLGRKKTVTQIHLGDGVLAGLGVWLHWITGKPVSITVHGLDLTYRHPVYQRYIHWSLPHYSNIIAVSQATAAVVQADFHLTAQVIPNGITAEDWPISQALGTNHCLLFVGRLVKRKGLAWFLEAVMPTLDNTVHLHIVGVGPELEHCQALVAQYQLTERVRFHGTVPPQDLIGHYTNAQALIMPNISIAGDMEGFGIVALEANICGLPVLAANVQGIKDVIVDGTTGFLVESSSVQAWKQAIQRLFQHPFSAPAIRQSVIERFSWQAVREQYLKAFAA